MMKEASCLEDEGEQHMAMGVARLPWLSLGNMRGMSWKEGI